MNAAAEDPLVFALITLAFLLTLLLTVGLLYVVYFLLTLPMRRAERAQMFLELLEIGFQNGRGAEETIESAAASHDVSTGARFHLVAEHIARGRSLSEALKLVPRFLPARVSGMLLAGERTGRLRAMLPACRAALTHGTSSTRSAQNYLVLLLFAFTPAAILVPFFIGRAILPKFQEVFASMMEGAALPAFTRLVLGASTMLITLQCLLIALLWLALFIYLGGPRLRRWFGRLAPRLMAAISLAVPWERFRIRRDFSACLAILLDAGLPEAEAVSLAAASMDNAVFVGRAAETVDRLRKGAPLPEALGAIDSDGELRWRFRNVAHTGTRFAQALQGWHESLEAKAFQLQQEFAQTATTILVLVNGLIVGSIVIAMFLPLIDLNARVALW